MNDFWKAWLRIWCWVVILFGLVLAGAGFAATDGLAHFLADMMNPATPDILDTTHRFAIGLMGAVTMGWGMTMLVSFDAAARLDDPQIWRGLTLALVTWYVIDSTLSIATGYALNAASNTVLLIGYLIPLWRSGALARR